MSVKGLCRYCPYSDTSEGGPMLCWVFQSHSLGGGSPTPSCLSAEELRFWGAAGRAGSCQQMGLVMCWSPRALSDRVCVQGARCSHGRHPWASRGENWGDGAASEPFGEENTPSPQMNNEHPSNEVQLACW